MRYLGCFDSEEDIIIVQSLKLNSVRNFLCCRRAFIRMKGEVS